MMDGFDPYDMLLNKLGKNQIGKSRLYINKSEDVDLEGLQEMVKRSVEHVSKSDLS